MSNVVHGGALSRDKQCFFNALAPLPQNQCASVHIGVPRVHFGFDVYIRVYVPRRDHSSRPCRV